MPELIDREELRRKIYERFGKYSTKVIAVFEEGRVMTDWAFLEPFLNAMPIIEPEVRHGRWILCKDQYNVDNDNGNYAYYCSCCKHQDVHAESAKVNFCWNCGALMDGGADNG